MFICIYIFLILVIFSCLGQTAKTYAQKLHIFKSLILNQTENHYENPLYKNLEEHWTVIYTRIILLPNNHN